MNTVQDQWNSFSKTVVPKNAPQVQVQEMKRAFYMGFAKYSTELGEVES